MSTWRKHKLSQVATIISGGTPKSGVSEYWGNDIRWITPKDMGQLTSKYVSDTGRRISKLGLDKSSAKLIASNSVILSTRAPIGHLAINTEAMSTNQGCRGLTPTSDLHTKYLYYFLLGSVDLLNELGTGTTFKELSKTALEGVEIPLPPIPEQQHIVAILDQAFADIEKARANAEKNLKNARELFDSYLNQVFSQRGEGWVENKLGDVCRLINGRAYKKHEMLTEGPYPILRVGNFFTNRSWFYSDLELHEDKYCDYGDLLYAWSASFGPRIWNGDKVIYHYHIWKIDIDATQVDKSYLFYLLEWDTEKIKQTQGTGTTMIHVTKGSMEDRLLPFASLSVQQHIAASLDKLSMEVQQLEKSYQQRLESLEELKKSLLQKAFSGELTKAEGYAA